VRLVRFQQKTGENKIGVLIGANYVEEITGIKLGSEPLLEFLQDAKAESKAQMAADCGKKHLDGGRQDQKGFWNLDSVTVLPPIAHPSKIICMGGNFSDHLAEGSSSLPPFPISFLKAPTSLIGHGGAVVYPKRVKLLDYEVELATIIGKKCKDVAREEALQYVAGFSVFNDISARDIQFAEMKRGFCNLGKNFETFGPMGPCLVTPDQAGDPDNLGMELRVNGQTRQLSSTKKMVFKVRELVEFFSSMTLEPGDIITSGTPSGVAIYRKPDKEPFVLRPGDRIEAKVDNLGRLQNTVVEPERAHNIVLPIESRN
jgi:2-keto-4-pentenoate hydratase/2-oxohepta-3-ene-1,7-dioic acid hydratase in catechol pathway